MTFPFRGTYVQRAFLLGRGFRHPEALPPREEPRFDATVLFKLNGTELTEGRQLQQELVPITGLTRERVVAAAQLSAIRAARPSLKKYRI